MHITVKLFATFRDGRFKIDVIELPEGENRVIDILQSLGISQEEVAICLVNGRDSNVQTILADGDTLSLFPPVGGG